MENPAAAGAHPVGQQPQPVTQNSVTHPAPLHSGNNRKKTGIFVVLAAIILMVGVGITVFVNQQEQDIRQHADTLKKGDSCGNLATATLLVFDRSNSMKQGAGASADELQDEENIAS